MIVDRGAEASAPYLFSIHKALCLPFDVIANTGWGGDSFGGSLPTTDVVDLFLQSELIQRRKRKG